VSDYTSPATYQRMIGLQRRLAEVLNQANREHMPADIAVFALARLQLELLRQMPPGGRTMIAGLIIEFLEQRTDDSTKNPLLVM
jgi:hypothetical protein